MLKAEANMENLDEMMDRGRGRRKESCDQIMEPRKDPNEEIDRILADFQQSRTRRQAEAPAEPPVPAKERKAPSKKEKPSKEAKPPRKEKAPAAR